MTNHENGVGFDERAAVLKFKKRNLVFGVRDFPVGCGPLKNQQLSCEQESSVKPKVPCLMSSLEEEEEIEEEAEEPEEVEVEEEESMSPICEKDEAEESMFMSLTSDQDKSELSNAPVTTARVYPPRRKCSAVRDFPPGCGRDNAQTTEVYEGVNSSKREASNDMESCLEDPTIVLALMAPECCPWTQKKKG